MKRRVPTILHQVELVVPVVAQGDDSAFLAHVLEAYPPGIAGSVRRFMMLQGGSGDARVHVRFLEVPGPLHGVPPDIPGRALFSQQQHTHIVQERTGEFSLDFMRDMSVEEAREWLTSLRGVGPKTASCVLLFSMGIPAFPVDTHVHRVTLRLGLMPPKTSPEHMMHLFEEALEPKRYYPYHKLLIRHGRNVCKAQRPLCDECSLAHLCDYYAEQQGEEQRAGSGSN